MIERKFVQSGITKSNINAFLKQKIRKAGFVSVDIQKTPVMARIIIRVERPGLVIGKRGATIKSLTSMLEERFGLENVQIKIEEVTVPELSAPVMARRIASSIERGVNFRRVIHWSLEKIMGAGAQGAEIVVSGKITGKGSKSRSERVAAGYLAKTGEQAKLVQRAHTQAIKKAGTIGVSVAIVPPGVVFPDKVDIKAALKQKQQKGGAEVGHTEAGSDTGPKPGGEVGKTVTTEN